MPRVDCGGNIHFSQAELRKAFAGGGGGELLVGSADPIAEARAEILKDAIDWKRITRLTIVDKNGRVLERRNQVVEPSVQDDGRTLKLFIKRAQQAASETKT